MEANTAPAGQETRTRIRAAPARHGSILKYKIDRGPVTFTLSVLGLRVALWTLATPFVCALGVLPLAVLGMFISPINHHHQHVNTFRFAWMNRLYELALALQSGVGPYAWVLHHNLGHHVNYLNQPPHESPDESHWTRADGSQMGRLEYSIHLLLHHQLDIFRVGMQHPRYLRAFLLMKLPLWGILGVAMWLQPAETLLVFVVPAFMTLFHTIWATYEHHAGMPRDGHLVASVNRDNRIYNTLTCNLGLHTAHHKRPGLHWSLLPELHAQIQREIPKEQVLKTFW